MARRSGLTRLALLYGMVEQMRSIELRIAAAAVEDVAYAAAIEAALHGVTVYGERAALAAGDREEWQVEETSRGVVELRIAQLAQLRAEREARFDEAATAHMASRVSMEQMARVVERERERHVLDTARRAQAESDDRFASRRAWTQVTQLGDGE